MVAYKSIDVVTALVVLFSLRKLSVNTDFAKNAMFLLLPVNWNANKNNRILLL